MQRTAGDDAFSKIEDKFSLASGVNCVLAEGLRLP